MTMTMTMSPVPRPASALLPPDAQRALLARAQAGDAAARDQLVLCNLRFVARCARRFCRHHPHYPVEDAEQAGVCGLLAAIPRCDLARGVAFLTYAHFHVTRAIALAGLAYLPLTLPNEFAHTAADDSCTTARARAARRVLRTRTGHAGATEYPFLDPHAPADPFAHDDVARTLDHLLAGLSHRERALVRARFGLDHVDGEPRKLEALAADHGVCRERVRQLLCGALDHMRRRARGR